MTSVTTVSPMHEDVHQRAQEERGSQISAPRTWTRCSVNSSAPPMTRKPSRTSPTRDVRKLPCGWAWRSSCSDIGALLFDNESSTKHAHWACKPELTRFLGQEFNRNGLTRRKLSALLKVREDY